MKQNITIGSRDSRLAIIQAELVIEKLKRACPELEINLVTMKTTGDKILNQTLDRIGGKGLFVKELDQALLDERIDLAVHSMKDLPMDLDERLPLLGCSAREDPRDVLVLKAGLSKPEECSSIGTASARRAVQLKNCMPSAICTPVRGNIKTRLQKLEESFDALILAAAGLKRLGLSKRIVRCFSTDEMIPAAGQGILALQGRKEFDRSLIEAISSHEDMIAVETERELVRLLEGGCSAPIAAYAELSGEELRLCGMYAKPGCDRFVTGSVCGTKERRKQLAEQLAAQLKRNYAEGA